MSPDAYSHFLETAIPSYAKANTTSGRWVESEAMARSHKVYQSLLPEGLETPNNHLFNIIENENKAIVGHLWVKVDENSQAKSAFILSLEIYERYRRKGYAKAALHTVEQVVAELGATSLGLHVFSYNSAAINLYADAGYQVISQSMQKPITLS
ncbi:Putative N-acetyltransferase YycN [Parendozoicomonas haliclonae]|uniref:Putative N-acetyltransferase YycN n=2 Tax=Parendozoicomonas haliclonae TaxID=1960125 RepID=A0A1X7ALL9_9GAMM|nr:putative N-acetyltransferase YycN [Parendozoicomonas haliclonae]